MMLLRVSYIHIFLAFPELLVITTFTHNSLRTIHFRTSAQTRLSLSADLNFSVAILKR